MIDCFHFDPELLSLATQAEQDCATMFARVEEIGADCEAAVLHAFQQCGVRSMHLQGSDGYGYGDEGRDLLDAVFAKAFGAEDALVRHHFVSGTHALSVALFGVLRAGDTMVSLTGKPYDTMQEVIGIRGQGGGSLREFGVCYRELDLDVSGKVQMEAIADAVKGCRVAYLQRSCGYTMRPSLSVATIGEMVAAAKQSNPDIVVIVDNCYGEFVERQEPTAVGADLMVGSLIKNPGGGIAQTGGYLAGRQDLVTQCAYRLTAVGIGKEVGASLGQNRGMYLGLFFAPSVVVGAMKTSIFALRLLKLMGYPVFPAYDAPRTDLIGAVKLGSPDRLKRFCRGIQAGSPIDSVVTPEPWEMPGYDSQVIMAAGTFTMGASIELSADAPLREPYTAWFQGGLTYQTGKLGILTAAQALRAAE